MDSARLTEFLVGWLEQQVNQAGCRGVVLGISGGIDSAVAGVIAKKAFPDNCMGILMPCESNPADVEDGQLLAETFAIPYKIVNLDDIYQTAKTKYESYYQADDSRGKLMRSNIKPRLRMLTLYYFAQALDYLVLGTSNKSEITVGYATKYGDNGVDLQILGDLCKEDVYALARYLEIPEKIINRAPSAGLWSGQTDEGEMGFTYADIDQYIKTGQGNPAVIDNHGNEPQK
jgi:NAD+ synthase